MISSGARDNDVSGFVGAKQRPYDPDQRPPDDLSQNPDVDADADDQVVFERIWELNIGDKVQWESSGKQKRGTIVSKAVDDGSDYPNLIGFSVLEIKRSQQQWDGDIVAGDLIVEVARTGKRGNPLVPYYYKPNPKNLWCILTVSE